MRLRDKVQERDDLIYPILLKLAQTINYEQHNLRGELVEEQIIAGLSLTLIYIKVFYQNLQLINIFISEDNIVIEKVNPQNPAGGGSHNIHAMINLADPTALGQAEAQIDYLINHYCN